MQMRNNKGITLIALIITIVVLMIIAVVSIQTLQDSRIIPHANKAVGDYKAEKEREEGYLTEYEALLDRYATGGNELENGSGNEIVNPPEIPDYEEYTLWTEVKSSNQTYAGETTGSSSNPIIPAGFMPKNTYLAKWDAENGPEADNGLVIVDTEGNEFVWVPVTTSISETGYVLGTEDLREPNVITKEYEWDEDTNTYKWIDGADKDPIYLALAGVTDVVQNEGEAEETINEYDFKKILEDEYAAMARSVNSNGGYYVGRYEVSIGSDGNAQSKTDGTNIVSATAAEDSANTWYGLYALCKTYNTTSVKSSMISGAQYDAMMTWMGDLTNTTISGYNTTRHPGYIKTDIIKNVYDVYGNSSECTLEADDTNIRVARSGNVYYTFTPSTRHGDVPTYNKYYYGSRLALYIVE